MSHAGLLAATPGCTNQTLNVTPAALFIPCLQLWKHSPKKHTQKLQFYSADIVVTSQWRKSEFHWFPLCWHCFRLSYEPSLGYLGMLSEVWLPPQPLSCVSLGSKFSRSCQRLQNLQASVGAKVKLSSLCVWLRQGGTASVLVEC